MKQVLILFGLLLSSLFSLGQNVGIGTTTPNNSAQLDIVSNSRGLLIPRMTTSQRTSIATPATGLLVYDTDTKGFWFYNGSAWTNIQAPAGGWSLTGNAGTTTANFIGTTDNHSTNNPLRFMVNGGNAGIIDSALYNTAIGFGSLRSNTTGVTNTASGYGSLYYNTTGEQNTANGFQSLFSNATGNYNTANGFKSLNSNTAGYANTAIGIASLYSNITGYYNTASGNVSLYSNITGYHNTANGNESLFANSTGYNNTASGSWSLYSNTTGNDNTANGYQALGSNTTGSSNVAMGTHALYSNTTTSHLVAIGDSALYNNGIGANDPNDGAWNTAVGTKALYSNTTGADNTAIGKLSLYFNTTGQFNTGSGAYSLISNTIGSFNTAIGYNARVSMGNLINATAIGANAVVDASDKVRIGDNSVTVIEGQVGWSFPSDARFKFNIHENVPGLDFITKLKPVTYYFDTKKLDNYTKTGIISNSNILSASYTGKQILHTGFLAQDVEKVAKELGYDFDGIHAPQNDQDHYSLSYSQFIMPLVKAVQEQQDMITKQQKIIEQLQKKVLRLEEKIK